MSNIEDNHYTVLKKLYSKKDFDGIFLWFQAKIDDFEMAL